MLRPSRPQDTDYNKLWKTGKTRMQRADWWVAAGFLANVRLGSQAD